MNKQRLLWWIIFLCSLIVLWLALTGVLYISIASNPEFFAFMIGLTGFWLFANRLIFGFGAIANTVYDYLENSNDVNKEKIAEKSHHQLLNLENYTVPSLILLWKGAFEPYRYTYYFAFFFTVALDILFELQILVIPSVSSIIKGFMLGAAIPTLLVWALELMSGYYLNRMILEKV